MSYFDYLQTTSEDEIWNFGEDGASNAGTAIPRQAGPVRKMGEPSCNSIVSEALSETNYQNWNYEIRQYLMGQDLWNIVDKGKEERLYPSNIWKQKNTAALHAILISCSRSILTKIERPISASDAWITLEKMLKVPPSASNYHMQYDPLFKAVYRGDWYAAKRFIDKTPGAVRAKCPGTGSNALQIAVTEEHLHIVEQLIDIMTVEELELKRNDRYTALAAAVEVGNLDIAKCLVRKNKRLLGIPLPTYGLPVVQAILTEQKHMVQYLFYAMRIGDLTWLDNGAHAAWALSEFIFVQRFDIALDLLEHAPYLALIDVTKSWISPVWALAQSKAFPSLCPLNFWQQRIYNYIKVPDSLTIYQRLIIQNLGGDRSVKKPKPRWISTRFKEDIKGIREKKLSHNQTSELLTRMCEVIKDTSDEVTIKNAKIHDALRRAACVGNVEFITSIVKANQPLLWNHDTTRKVFEDAIHNRQAKVFSLIYGLPNKTAIVSYHDEYYSNMLHRAAALAPSALRKLIPGAALQMQKELQWFKAVEELASPGAREALNSNYLNPRDLFTENHKDLVIEGEKWIKDTASSSTVVGALIVTVTFAAAFTFPGGNDQNNGFPMFFNDKLYRVFMMSNAVALFSSTTSVLMFLGILTSRYGEEDFLYSLPKKLIIGLSTLFLSIAAMIIAFCVGLSLMFHNKLWIIIPSVFLAAVPIILFVLMQSPLLVDIVRSTYGASIFDRNAKQRWV